MKEKKTIVIILLIVTIIVVLTFALLLLIQAFNGNRDREKAKTNTNQQEIEQGKNQNISQGISGNIVNTEVETAQFIENLKAYYTGKKVARVKLSRTSKDGNIGEVTQHTKGLDAQKDKIEITNNHIRAIIAEDMYYDWDYQIDDEGATFIVKKDNPTAYDKIVLSGNVNHLSTMFVAYTELLGSNPKEALAFWHLAVREINKNKISDSKTNIENEIFSTIEENLDTSYSFTLKIKNGNIKNLQRLLEVEKGKESTTRFIGY